MDCHGGSLTYRASISSVPAATLSTYIATMSERGSRRGSGLASGNSSARTVPARPKAGQRQPAAARGTPVPADASVVFTAPENTTPAKSNGDGHSGRPSSKFDGKSPLDGRKPVTSDSFFSAELGFSA